VMTLKSATRKKIMLIVIQSLYLSVPFFLLLRLSRNGAGLANLAAWATCFKTARRISGSQLCVPRYPSASSMTILCNVRYNHLLTQPYRHHAHQEIESATPTHTPLCYVAKTKRIILRRSAPHLETAWPTARSSPLSNG
jgi:hypothetical protein